MTDHELTDDEARAIARQIAKEARALPGASNQDASAQARELDDANEARVERALVEEGIVPPSVITKPDSREGA